MKGDEMKKIFSILGLGSLLFIVSCGSSSSTSSSSSTTTNAAVANTSSAVTAAFSSGSGSSSVNQQARLPMHILKALIAQARAQGSEDTCDSVSNGPTNVTSSAQGNSGTFGSASDSVTVDTDTSYCQDSSGNSNTNSSNELFASFTVSSASVTCDDGNNMTMSGTGIWRNRPSLGFYPQIYGTFTVVDADGNSEEVDCSIALSEGEEIDSSSTCTDSSDTAIEMDTSVSCSIDANS